MKFWIKFRIINSSLQSAVNENFINKHHQAQKLSTIVSGQNNITHPKQGAALNKIIEYGKPN